MSQVFRWVLGLIAASLATALQARPSIRTTDGGDLGLIIVGAITNSNQNNNVGLVKEIQTGKVTAVKAGFRLLNKTIRVKEVTAKYMIVTKNAVDILVYQDKFAREFAGFNKVAGTDNLPKPVVVIDDGFERNGNKIKVTPALRDKLINQDLSKVLMQATAIPKMEGGKVVGFRILQIDENSIYDKAGLKNNDVVTSINGIGLSSVAGAVQLLRSLKDTESVQIDFTRQGIKQSLELDVSM